LFQTMLESFVALAAVGATAGIVGWRWGARTLTGRQARHYVTLLEAERAASQHLCFSTIEALAYAIEAGDPYSYGHLDCVQRCALAMARALGLSPQETMGLKAAALLHNIGRLGVPEHILHKADSLTAEEQEKLRVHPVLGARILASIPFSTPVVPLVRHHAEHWDGNGYPDRLKGTAIPLGARILAVANAYSALLHPRPYREACTPGQALAEIEARSGAQFDPAVVAAFRTVAAELRLEGAQTPPASLPVISADALDEARAALDDIAAAQRETLGLYTLAQSLADSLHLEAMASNLLTQANEIVGSASCVLFLPEDDGEYLHAQAAVGVNERHLLGSIARIGSYLTGRAYSRGEIMRASFLTNDLLLRDVSDPWIPFRSTLIAPLMAGGKCIGALNFYSEEPDAFDQDACRIVRLIASQAAHAVDNARRFSEVQESAYTDALTGLRNARFLREFLEREINRANRDGSSLAVLNIDLDHFKQVNDRYGHSAGDQALRDVAELLMTHVRNYDLAVRYAGDEFVVVLSGADRLAAEVVATKLKKAMERHVQKLVAHDAEFPPIGLSIGVAIYPEEAHDMQGLLCSSDAAMYQDKQARRSGREAA
jgi:diguanylate cyclase (GGDEF)-like protein